MIWTLVSDTRHHRYGRSGKNFCKQTRIWDTMFGTTAPREEERAYAEKKRQIHQ